MADDLVACKALLETMRYHRRNALTERAKTTSAGKVGSGTLFDGAMLTKGKCLRPAEFRTLLELAHATLAREFMVFMLHLDVVFGIAKGAMLLEKFAVAPFEDIHLRVREKRVSMSVNIAVLGPHKLGKTWCSVDGVLAVEDQERS